MIEKIIENATKDSFNPKSKYLIHRHLITNKKITTEFTNKSTIANSKMKKSQWNLQKNSWP